MVSTGCNLGHILSVGMLVQGEKRKIEKKWPGYSLKALPCRDIRKQGHPSLREEGQQHSIVSASPTHAGALLSTCSCMQWCGRHVPGAAVSLSCGFLHTCFQINSPGISVKIQRQCGQLCTCAPSEGSYVRVPPARVACPGVVL